MNLINVVTNNKAPLPFISPISSADKTLVQKAIRRWRPNSKNYEDSWGYIIQATRYGGFKWYDPSSASLIFFGRKSENDSRLVIPNFFAASMYLTSALKRIQEAYLNQQMILKNVTSEDVPILTSYGFRPYKPHEVWNEKYRFDDQTYPQLIADLHELAELKGRGYRLIRKVLNKKPSVDIRPYTDRDKAAVLAIFASKDGTTDKSLAKQTKGIYYVSHAMYPSADLYKFVIVDKISNDIIGFTALSEITAETVASVACLFKPNVGIVSLWGSYQSLMIMRQKGFRWVNFGGSETGGSYNFLHEKFRPIEEIQKIHLIFGPII